MKQPVFYMETGSVDPHYNLAFEEYVLNHCREGEILLLWQNDNTIVIGQNQNAEAEINRSFVEQHGIHVVRRMTGGGAVYHDLGNLNYSFITDAGDAAQLTMETFTRPVVEALKAKQRGGAVCYIQLCRISSGRGTGEPAAPGAIGFCISGYRSVRGQVGR